MKNDTLKKLLASTLGLFAFTALPVVSGCAEEEAELEREVDDAGDAIDDGLDDAGRTVDDATDDVNDAMTDDDDDVDNALDDAEDDAEALVE
jgi:hypothetical protein